MGIWSNGDGLEVRFGLDRATEQPTGNTSAEEKTFVCKIADASTLGEVDILPAAGDEAFIPAGAIIKDAYFVVDTAFTSGGSATLDLGIKSLDGLGAHPSLGRPRYSRMHSSSAGIRRPTGRCLVAS